MAPTGGANNPGTNLVTHFMALNVANPVMDVEPTLCCLTHDIGNHYCATSRPTLATSPRIRSRRA